MATALVLYVAPGEVIDYTPDSAVSAGDVVVAEDLVGVAKHDIAADAQGELALEGIFDFPKSTASSSAIDFGKKVYWDEGDEEAKEDSESGANKFLGLCVRDAEDADEFVRVKKVLPGS
ncbi:MAG TPA: DUF2190 family protein [Phycisphaerae bacterium]|nr:DUF2190 family protein [Phycisphaerae bacterium]